MYTFPSKEDSAPFAMPCRATTELTRHFYVRGERELGTFINLGVRQTLLEHLYWVHGQCRGELTWSNSGTARMPITYIRQAKSKGDTLRPSTLCQHSPQNNPPTTKPFYNRPSRTCGEQGVQDSAPPPSIAKAFGLRLPKGRGEEALPGFRSLPLSLRDLQNAARAARGSVYSDLSCRRTAANTHLALAATVFRWQSGVT